MLAENSERSRLMQRYVKQDENVKQDGDSGEHSSLSESSIANANNIFTVMPYLRMPVPCVKSVGF